MFLLIPFITLSPPTHKNNHNSMVLPLINKPHLIICGMMISQFQCPPRKILFPASINSVLHLLALLFAGAEFPSTVNTNYSVRSTDVSGLLARSASLSPAIHRPRSIYWQTPSIPFRSVIHRYPSFVLSVSHNFMWEFTIHPVTTILPCHYVNLHPHH